MGFFPWLRISAEKLIREVLPASRDLGRPERVTDRASFFEVLKGTRGERSLPGKLMMVEIAEDAASVRDRPSGSVGVGAGGTGVYSGSCFAVFFFCAAEAWCARGGVTSRVNARGSKRRRFMWV